MSARRGLVGRWRCRPGRVRRWDHPGERSGPTVARLAPRPSCC